MNPPPVLVERVLLSLAAGPVQDDVLGDLAEEFARRSERDGASHARWWYRREALRTMPHLVRMSLRGFSLSDLGRLGVAITGALVITMGLWALLVTTIVSLDRAGAISRALSVDLRLVVGLLFTVTLGFLASLFARKAPLIGAAAAGIVWCAVPIALAALAGSFGWPTVVNLFLVLPGPIVGGFLHAALRPRPPLAR